MKQTAVVVSPDGTTQRIEFEKGNSLKTFQTAVGGLIEPVSLYKDFEMYVNEDGIAMKLPPNLYAYTYYREAFNIPFEQPCRLFGNAVFFGGVDRQGDSVGLSEQQIDDLETWIKYLRVVVANVFDEIDAETK